MSNLSDIRVIWKDRGYPFESYWADAFKRAGCHVTKSIVPANADGYVLLQGILSSNDHLMRELMWLEDKPAKKIGIVINAHKLQHQRSQFFKATGVVAGMEFDDRDAYKHHLHVPAALNHHVYHEDIKRADRRHLVGFRGHLYRKGNAVETRKRIMDAFSEFPQVKPGNFIWDGWSGFLNTIKTIPAVEASYNGHNYLVSRHFDAVGTKTVQVMYPCSNGIIEDGDYIKLETDHSNLDDVMEKIKDESFCEALTARVREKMMDSHTIDHRVNEIIEWLR